MADTGLFTVSSPPAWHCGRSTTRLMANTLLALAPAAALAVVHFGLPAARVVALSCVTAVVTELACRKAMGRDPAVDDLSALVTGVVFAFLLPASAPWWLVVTGSAAAIAMGKQLFGGLGGSPLNPACVGWAVVRISWPARMSVELTMLDTVLDSPLAELKYYGASAAAQWSWQDLLLGGQLGPLGAVQVAALALGGLYLLALGVVRWQIPAAVLAGTYLTAWVFVLADPGASPAPLFHVLAGGTVFAAFFLATEYASSPVGTRPMLLYGLMCGALIVVIRQWGVYLYGAPFAVLLANLATPLFDRIRGRAFGAGRASDA